MIKKDDRTDEQKKTHVLAIVARDKFLSGWGEARGKGGTFGGERGDGVAVARYMRDEKPGSRIQYKLAGEAPAISPRAQRRKERKVAA